MRKRGKDGLTAAIKVKAIHPQSFNKLVAKWGVEILKPVMSHLLNQTAFQFICSK